MAAELATRKYGEHLLQTAAALATLGPAVASHQSAAIIHGMDLLTRPRVVTLTRPAVGSKSGRPRVRLHFAQLPTEHITVVHGMRVTTAARTVIDLARVLEFRAGVVTADSALRNKLVTKPELESPLAESSRRMNRRRVADVIAFADGRAESVLESIARVAFKDCGLPPPELQVWVGGAETVGRVDFLWRRYRTVSRSRRNHEVPRSVACCPSVGAGQAPPRRRLRGRAPELAGHYREPALRRGSDQSCVPARRPTMIPSQLERSCRGRHAHCRRHLPGAQRQDQPGDDAAVATRS